MKPVYCVKTVVCAIALVFSSLTVSYAEEVEEKERRTFSDRAFFFYQEHVSSRDGPRCPYYPTCSEFALRAVKKHGFVKGLFMTTDRLMREYPGMHKAENYPVTRKHGVEGFYDPVP